VKEEERETGETALGLILKIHKKEMKALSGSCRNRATFHVSFFSLRFLPSFSRFSWVSLGGFALLVKAQRGQDCSFSSES
jgi:hypothetical protein